jgi:hypothetical protein
MNRAKSQNLKTVVRGAYDIQKLRIQMGNRIVSNFKAKLGQAPGKPEEELDEDGKHILANLRASFRKITDGVKTFPKQTTFVGDEVISDYTELCLIAQYIDLERYEDQHFKRLGSILREYPIYTGWLESVKGIGPAMAGVIISEIDISKARYPSSLWKYAGLDVVAEWRIDHIEPISGNITDDLLATIPVARPLQGDESQVGERFSIGPDGRELSVMYQWDDRPESCRVVYRFQEFGGRSRRSEHLVKREFTSKSGEVKQRDSITFNPWLKTKLVGVLATSFLRVQDSPYAEVYRAYKHRLESHPKYQDGQVNDSGAPVKGLKGHRHNMAMRYMVKRFLADLYHQWRTIEGLPVSKEYHEAKLGHVHVA